MSGVASTIPGTAPLARFAFLSVQQSRRFIRLIAFTHFIACLASFHPIPATAQHRFNVPTSERGMQNAKQAAQIRLLETWARLIKTAITVTEDGNVGIGTETPFRFGVNNSRILTIETTDETLLGSPSLEFSRFVNVLPSESEIFAIRAMVGKIPQQVSAISSSLQESSLLSADLLFWTRKENEPITVRMRINANGNVGIGTETPTQKLHVAGNGLFTGTLTATAFYQQSDRNLKQHITPISSPFTLLKSIEGKRFQWKENGQPSYGIIAQDVEKVMPEAVVTSDNGVKSVDYSQMIAPLIEAVKQLENRVHELEAAEANPMLKGAGNGVFRILNIGAQ